MSIDLSQVPSLETVQKELARRSLEKSKKDCADSLAEFVKQAWHILEPATELTWGNILDVMCEELEGLIFNEGQWQPRKLGNVPPGTMKSLLWSVMFPAWVWGPAGHPEKSFTGVSHEQGLAIRDARKMRMLVESDWFQERWPLKMASDANAKTLFENEKRGFRQAVPFRSMTGRRSDFVIVDDPHSAEDANSPAYREEAARIFRETLPTRVNNDKSAILLVMQRLHEEDISGIILAEDDNFGYDTMIFPMRFEKDRADPRDWRTKEGELLFPERFSEEAVEKLERLLLAYGSAGQLQQRPVPRGGGLFQTEWFKLLPVAPVDISAQCRGWDLAATVSDTAAYTAGVKMLKTRDGRIVIVDVKRDRLTPNGVRSLIRQTANEDGVKCRVSIPKDPGQAAKGQVEQFSQDLMGYDCRFTPETGSKEMRAIPLAAQAEAGNVYLVQGKWNKDFLEEIGVFPMGKYKDQTDAATRAFSEILLMEKMNAGFSPAFGPKILD